MKLGINAPPDDPITLTQFQWLWPTFQGHRLIFMQKLQKFIWS